MFANSATGSEEQSQGVEHVNTAVSHIDKVTQTTARHAEESAGAAGKLDARVETLRKSMAALSALVGGHRV